MKTQALAASVLLLTACGDVPFAAESLTDVRGAVRSDRAVLVDVREPWEWDLGHLAGARLIPFTALRTDPSLAAGLPRDRPVYLHCVAGVRARRAAKILKGLGYDARPLKAGYVELAESGFENVPAPRPKYPKHAG